MIFISYLKILLRKWSWCVTPEQQFLESFMHFVVFYQIIYHNLFRKGIRVSPWKIAYNPLFWWILLVTYYYFKDNFWIFVNTNPTYTPSGYATADYRWLYTPTDMNNFDRTFNFIDIIIYMLIAYCCTLVFIYSALKL